MVWLRAALHFCAAAVTIPRLDRRNSQHIAVLSRKCPWRWREKGKRQSNYYAQLEELHSRTSILESFHLQVPAPVGQRSSVCLLVHFVDMSGWVPP